MLKKFRLLLTYGLVATAFLAVAFVAGFLQEFAGDDIPEAAREAGVTLPLDDPWIEVNLQRMTLALHDGEVMVKRYNIGYGKHVPGKVANREGSTPLGEFRIVRKQKRRDMLTRGSRFLVFDFPNEMITITAWEGGSISEEEYSAIMRALSMGEEPPHDTALGGPLGIHGNFFPFQERRFTDGSIGLSNADVNELFEHVPVGARVVIKDR